MGAAANHWLRLRFSGVVDAELIGARVGVSTEGMKQYRWIHSNHSYKSGGSLEAHFGLARHERVDLSVVLLSGETISFTDIATNRYLDVDLRGRDLTVVR
jgi:hypothetical protein